MSSGPSLTRRMIRVLPLALMLLATGCGFQLRGSSPVPPALQPLAVVCDRQVPEPLCQAVREQLELGRVQVPGRDGGRLHPDPGRLPPGSQSNRHHRPGLGG